MSKYTHHDLIQITEDYIHDVLQSDLNVGMVYGCECGCGGDYYTENPDEWDSLCLAHDDAAKAFLDMCEYLGVSVDD